MPLGTADCTAIILAGGESSRMGRDKALLRLGSRTLIERARDALLPHFGEVIVSAAREGDYASLGLRVVADRSPGEGPLMGIASALEAASFDTAFVTAVDVPEMDMALVRRLIEASEGFDGAVFVAPDGRPEPTFAVYRRCVLPAAREALAQGERRVSELIRRCRIRLVPLGPDEGPGNVNTPADYEALRGSRDA